jgi:transposase-like protein
MHLLEIMSRLDTPIERVEAPGRQRQTRRNKDDYAHIAMAYEAGESMPAIAERLGIHKATVAEILQRLGVEARDRRFFTAEQVEEVSQQYLAGSSLGQLAELYGCYPTTIMRTLERAGVKRRPPN